MRREGQIGRGWHCVLRAARVSVGGRVSWGRTGAAQGGGLGRGCRVGRQRPRVPRLLPPVLPAAPPALTFLLLLVQLVALLVALLLLLALLVLLAPLLATGGQQAGRPMAHRRGTGATSPPYWHSHRSWHRPHASRPRSAFFAWPPLRPGLSGPPPRAPRHLPSTGERGSSAPRASAPSDTGGGARAGRYRGQQSAAVRAGARPSVRGPWSQRAGGGRRDALAGGRSDSAPGKLNA